MLKIAIVAVEIVILLICFYLGYQWTQNPEGNYEPWLCLAGLAIAALDVFRRYEIHFIKREGRIFTPGELVTHSEELRKKFKEEIYKCRAEDLRKDVIIRHVNRMDSYPEINEKGNGISSWFRVGLLDTYHRGVLVALRAGTLSEGPDGYRYTNYKEGENGDINVYMVGKIPYEYIENVNFDGDEYYSYPHIFCHFANKGEPYEEMVFCEKIDIGSGHFYYKEVASYVTVSENSQSWGGEYFA